MEATEKIPGFAKARISAEKTARIKKQPEIDLHEIYEEISPEYESYMNLEMDYERQILQQNTELKNVFDCAVSLNKTIVLVSDMYLPSKYLGSVLKEKGFDGFHRLYVSGEHHATKKEGDLFKIILEDLEINPQELLHIGDHDKSDVKTPKMMGIYVIKYEKMIGKYFKTHKKEHIYYRLNKNYERSMIVGMDALFQHNSRDITDDFWYEFGYRYGGPVNTAFASFINENAEKNSVLLFVARDGYNALQAYNALFGTIKSHYVYASRIFNILFGINGRDYPGYEKDIIHYFSNRPEVKELNGEPPEIFNENLDLFKKLMHEELDKYRSYINQYMGSENLVYVVDASTRKYSSQTLISEVTNKNVKGLYYTLIQNKSDEYAKGFCDNYRVLFELTSIDVPEFLMTSDENPIIGMDDNGNPVYNLIATDEWFRTDAIPRISAGMMDYLKTVKSVFGNFIPAISHDSVDKWILNLARFMSDKERTHLEKLDWASNPTHSEYHKLFFSLSDLPKFILGKLKDGYNSTINRIRGF